MQNNSDKLAFPWSFAAASRYYCLPLRGMLQFSPPDFRRQLGEWCNGSTAVFGTVDPGSNPGSPALNVQPIGKK